MANYIQVMPGVYQIIPDPNTDEQAARERLNKFREKLIADYERYYKRADGKRTTRELLSTE